MLDTEEAALSNTLKQAPLDMVPLERVASILKDVLHRNFEHVSVQVVDGTTIDLQQAPWHLPSSGLCGTTRVLDVGGTININDPKHHYESHSIPAIAKVTGLSDGFYLGAAAGDANHVGVNSELIPCVDLKQGSNKTMVSYFPPESESFTLEEYDHDRIGPLANLFGSDGKQGPMLHVVCKARKGDANFVSCMREGLESELHNQCVGVGGVFRMNSGQFKAHIMPDFRKEYMTDKEVGSWLKFYEFGPGATFMSVFVAGEPRHDLSLHLRKEHTHFFNVTTGEGGHYHYDTTPREVEYEGYFTLAEHIFRVDDAYDKIQETN